MLWSTVLIHVHFSCEVRHDALVLESDGKIVPLWIETAVGCMVSTLVRGSGPFRVRVARGAESDAFHWFVVECDRQAIAQRRLLVWFKFRSVIKFGGFLESRDGIFVEKLVACFASQCAQVRFTTRMLVASKLVLMRDGKTTSLRAHEPSARACERELFGVWDGAGSPLWSIAWCSRQRSP